MMRVCSLDTCPVGVCTQNPELRKKFTGKPEHVMNLMRFLAEDVRRYMAQLGFHTMDEMIGRNDLLQQKADMPAGLNLERLCACVKPEKSIADKQWYDFHLDSRADTALMDESFERVLKNQSHWHRTAEVHNTDRAFGTRLGSRITRMYPKGIKDDTFTIDCHGSGGQSFGAFIPSGFTLNLTGDCNDYLGKGLSGGILSVKSEPDVIYDPGSSILIGNVALYGATSGKAFISGTAGERFAVRNSGALAVCEGCGDHGLEYMTGGTVMILGSTGRNFAAGMSGGTAYVYDPLDTLYASLNTALVKMDAVSEKHDMEVIHALLNEHVQRTDSVLAKRLLDRFEEEIVHFKRIVPTEYQKMMKLIHAYEEKGLPADEAELEAFNAAKGGH
jgi:glutamate synthase (ferredoxin)